jgi:nucleoside-diphosphate-sugar epimerase
MTAKSTPTIAITGAGGFLGSTLVTYFSGKGWQVRALVRNPKKYKAKKGVSYVAYDLTEPPTKQLLKGVDYLVHAAYIKQDRSHPDAVELNVQGAGRLLEASRKSNVSKNLFVSSMSAHEEAISAYGRQKLLIEKLFDTTGGVSLRSGLIIGDGGIVKDMVSFMKSKHVVPLIGGGKQPLQILAVDDLAQAIEQALTSDVQGTLTVAHPHVYSYKEFYKTISRQLGIFVIFVPLSFSLLLLLLRLAKLSHLPLSIGEDNIRGLQKLRSVDTKKDLKRLGIQPATLEDTLRKMELK